MAYFYIMKVWNGIFILSLLLWTSQKGIGRSFSGDDEDVVPLDRIVEGSRFYVGFFENDTFINGEPSPPVLWITTMEPTPVNFMVASMFEIIANTIAVPGEVTRVDIPNQYHNVVSDLADGGFNFTAEFKGIYIVTQDELTITVYGQNQQLAPNDVYLALPVVTFNLPGRTLYEYIVVSGPRYLFNPYVGVALIVGTENDTDIVITPPRNTGLFQRNDVVTIQRFQTIYLRVVGEDISGTRIVANKPISVFSGSACAAGVAQDHSPCHILIEQIPPIDTWGTEVVTVPLKTRASGDIIKIVASYNATMVSVTQTNFEMTSDNIFTLNANDFVELFIRGIALIQSNHLIEVFRFGESFYVDYDLILRYFTSMSLIPPREQYLNTYLIATPPLGEVGYNNYINVAISSEFDVELLTVDNAAVNVSEFSSIRRNDGSVWGYGAQLELDSGVHVISHENPNATFLVTMYGFNDEVSWGCAGGVSLTPTPFLSSVSVIALNPQTVAQFLIFDCTDSSLSSSFTTSQTVGQPIILRCTAEIRRPVVGKVTFIWSGNGTILRTSIPTELLQDHYVISQLNTSDDGSVYQCDMLLDTTTRSSILPICGSGKVVLNVTAPAFTVAVSSAGSVIMEVVGNPQNIQCTASITFNGVEDDAVAFTWLGPEGISIVNTSRMTISQTNSSNNKYISILHFSYLMEIDEGKYTCQTRILQTNETDAFEIQTIVPAPSVRVAVRSDQIVGQSLTLDCFIVIIRGINSQVNVAWNDSGGIQLSREDNIAFVADTNPMNLIYNTSHTIPQLTAAEDGMMFTCEVVIKTDPLVKANSSITLDVIEDDKSPSAGLISGIVTGGAVFIVIIIILTVLLCLFLLRKRRLRKSTMKAVQLNRYPMDNLSYAKKIDNICVVTRQISFDEWKEHLAAYLIDYSALDIRETVASGNFGVVYRGLFTSKENKITEVAIKTLKDFSLSTAEEFIKECNIANTFDHPNVLSLTGVCIIPEEAAPLMIMPYMQHGDVKSYVRSKRANTIKIEEFPAGLSDKILTEMCLDVATGMEYLSLRRFIHRDLAARNCMLDQNLNVKVADFGLSRDVYITEYYQMSQSKSAPLPVKWLAPEALFDRVFSEKTDVWAFGVTCWEIFSLGLQPYPSIGPSEVGEYIKSGKVLKKPHLSSDKMYEMMKSCWNFIPEDRPEFTELVKNICEQEDRKELPKPKQLVKKGTAGYLSVYD